MKWAPRHRLRFSLFRSPQAIRSEVQEEIDAHLAMRQAELEREGLSPAAARNEALRLFGDRAATEWICVQADLREERSMRRSA